MGKQAAAAKPARAGRPVAFVREAAIEAAMHLFWKKGYLAVPASELADAMRIRRSSFYNSFGSREAVFEEALAKYATCTPDAPLFRVAPGQPVAPVLVGVLREVCRVRAADREARGCMLCNSVAELVGVEPTVGPLLEGAVRNMTAVLEQLLGQAVRQGEMAAPEDLAGSARSFVAFLMGLNTISKVVRDEKQLWAMCTAYLKVLGLPAEARAARQGARQAPRGT